MCISVVNTNESVEPQPSEERLVGVMAEFNCVEETLDGSSQGKKRKMSKTDSPNSSTFDVATLIDAIHREVEGDDALPSEEEPKLDGNQWPSSTSLKFYDDFDFIDFGDTAEEQVVVSAPEQPKLEKRGSLGKRSRGLGRSQTIKTCLCLLGEES